MEPIISVYANAVGAVIEHRVTDDEAGVVTDYSEPVVVTHECGQIEHVFRDRLEGSGIQYGDAFSVRHVGEQ